MVRTGVMETKWMVVSIFIYSNYKNFLSILMLYIILVSISVNNTYLNN
jgi:hypothetical protein